MMCKFVLGVLFSGDFYLRGSFKTVGTCSGGHVQCFLLTLVSFIQRFLGHVYPNFTGLKLFSRN